MMKILLSTMAFSLLAVPSSASTVTYYDCELVQGDPAYNITAFHAESGSNTFVTLTHDKDPSFYEVFDTRVSIINQVMNFEGQNFSLTLVKDSKLPTETYSGHLRSLFKGRVIDSQTVCVRGSYQKPDPDLPGGVSVHN